MTLEDREHLEAARVAAKEAGRILMERFGRRPQVYYKGRINLVTDVDRRSEAFSVSFLHRRSPDHPTPSEEGQGHRGNGEPYWSAHP